MVSFSEPSVNQTLNLSKALEQDRLTFLYRYMIAQISLFFRFVKFTENIQECRSCSVLKTLTGSLAIQPQRAYILVVRWLISGNQRLKERERYIFLWLGGSMARQQRLKSQNTLYEKGLLCFNGWPGGSVAHQ